MVLRFRHLLIFLQIALILLIVDASWLNKYFRVPHKVHFKLNYDCKNVTLCEKPVESETYLATVLWPEHMRKYEACLDYKCICPAFKGTVKDEKCILPSGEVLAKSVRKEYRQMTKDEREAYVKMMNEMQEDGTYRLIGVIHQAAGVHSGPSFFPWHREFLKRTEFIFRLYNHTLAIPYWDSVLDSYLPNPADSVWFSKHLMGEADKNGDVYNSVFKNFTTLDDRPTFRRKLGKAIDGELMNNNRIDWIMDQTNITHGILAYSMPLIGCDPYEMDDKFLEYSHDYVHYFVNGDMEDRTTSSNDPIFFTHHSFVDYLWELWRLKQQTRKERETVYPPDNMDCMPPWHFRKAKMPLLKPYRNIDGMSNIYSDNLVDYAPRPTCQTSSEECKSEFLWCDTLAVEAHCVSKIKLNGNCTGFEWSKEACYEGRCVDGVCQDESKIKTTTLVDGPSEFDVDKSMQRLRQKTQEFYKKKPHKQIKLQIVDVKELSTAEKVKRFM
ncbi:Tyrosinase-Cu-bd domain-containing protein [Aphelenchoides bicaudatus]|nr:Tyrosinase-Cu-bd domain-containing protein [Aphelenchoides bicaudatus]